MNSLMEIMDRVSESFTDEENDLFIDCRFPYIMTKAHNYLNGGPEVYRSTDALGFPSADWTDKDLELIKSGCEQMMEGIGFTADRPFRGLGVRGFYILFNMFHFDSVERKTKRLGIGKMLDQITFEHVIDGGRVTYYNLVERS